MSSSFPPVRTAAAVTLAVAIAWTAAGCGRDSTLHPQRPAVPDNTQVPVNAARVRDLCDFFAYRSLETLSEPLAQGNVNVLAERPGVPYNLAKTAHDYYADGITAPDTPDHRRTLTTRYETVLFTCRDAGTGWVRP